MEDKKMNTLSKKPVNNPFRLIDEIFNNERENQKNAFLKESHCGTMPRMNIKDQEKYYFIELAAPGMKKENFSIQVDQMTLTIKGNHEDTSSREYTHQEFCFEQFERRIKLPKEADIDKIMAEYKNGILSIGIPKKQEAIITNKEIQIL